MDSTLLFRVLVVAPGFEPTFFTKVDPLAGPLAAVLPARKSTNPPSQTIRGRVVEGKGEPIAQAVVSVNTTVIGDTYYGSPPEGTDPLAVTDDAGEFSLSSPVKFDAMELQVEARTFARGIFRDVKPGGDRRDFKVTEGASITGRVVRDGQPVKDVVIGACGTDRTMGNFVGDFSIACQADGRFLLPNLPPNHEYFLYGMMNSLTNLGTLPLRRVKPGGDGQTLDVGDYVVAPGRRLAGQVRLSDDKPLADATRLTIGREEAWDVLAVELPPDGRFKLANLPGNETLSLGARVKGYRPSPQNASYERLNGFGLTGRLEADKTNLVFLLEPGEVRPGTFEPEPEEDRPQNLPLGGIETKRAVKPGMVITGGARDAETKQPLAEFRVTPGKTFDARSGGVQWMAGRAVTGRGGAFSVDAGKVERFVVLQAEAPGYLPARSEALAPGRTNWTFELKRGTGPVGVLLASDGQPAGNAQVFHLGPGEQAYLPRAGELRGLQQGEDSTSHTDAQGRFQFPPKYGDSEIVAVTDRGFARVSAARLADDAKVRLLPWARVTGRLVQAGQPAANENVEIQFAGGFRPAHGYVNLQGTKTDAEGRFVFERVPPVELQIATRHILGENSSGWTLVPQKSFTPKPGESLDLGDVEKVAEAAFPR